MIALFTDFGRNGPYQGQLKNAIYRIAPEVKVIDLMADAPLFNPIASSYLLSALANDFDHGTVFLCVVDPGVGSSRAPCIVFAKGYCFVGPNNGLFSVVASTDDSAHWWEISCLAEDLSPTFHGRDLFAPVAARLALNFDCVAGLAKPSADALTANRLGENSVIYIDAYGNIMTSIQAATIPASTMIMLGNCKIGYARTYSESEAGQTFWYENSIGLVEIAINCGSASKQLACTVGDQVGMI